MKQTKSLSDPESRNGNATAAAPAPAGQSDAVSLNGVEGAILQPKAIRQAQAAVWRPGNGTWYIRRPDGSLAAIQFGQQNDVPVPADYEFDGEGRTDIAVVRTVAINDPVDTQRRQLLWYINRNQAAGTQVVEFGEKGDIPVPADYNGDGLADIAVVRPNATDNTLTWFITRSEGISANFFGFPFGFSTDILVVADYDGDGRADVAVFRPTTSTWYIIRSLSGGPDDPAALSTVQFGQAGDIPVPADYDGDGSADIAVFRPSNGTWYIRRSFRPSDSPDFLYVTIQFGQNGDIPVPADYDGDGKADIAVVRLNTTDNTLTWHILQSSDNKYITFSFGEAGDCPVPGRYLGTAISQRQSLTRYQRAEATSHQITQPSFYDVPFPQTPDEIKFPRFAASFHKLLAHEPATGLLNDNGTLNYNRLLQGLRGDTSFTTDNQPSSDFDGTALNSLELLNRNPLGGKPRVLINPRSAKALSIKGPDIASIRVSRLLYNVEDENRLLNEISLANDYSAAEIIELYAQAILRDAGIGQYAGNTDTQLAINALNSFGQYFVWGYRPDGTAITAIDRPVTVNNIFRGPSEGDVAGDYLSVFLRFRRAPQFASGCSSAVADLIGAGPYAGILSEELRVPQGISEDFSTTVANYARIQNAEIPERYPNPNPSPGNPNPRQFFTGLGPIQSGRNLGEYVHVDNVYEWAIRAADILSANQYERSRTSPYRRIPADPQLPPIQPYYPNESDGQALGAPDAYALIGGVREVAERAAWTQKWLVARRGRPEVMAALVHLVRSGGDVANPLPISPRLRATSGPVHAFLERIKQWNLERNQVPVLNRPPEANYLLALMFPEGSPAHPAWPSGHATVAGATITVLKAIWDDRQPIFRPDQPSPAIDSDKLEAVIAPSGTDAAARALTVGGELDKLASNIAFGRDWGGVHYRTDGEHGIVLGEEIAIRYLQDHIREYREQFRYCRGFELTKRNGQRICITADGVTNIPASDAQSVPTTLRKSLL